MILLLTILYLYAGLTVWLVSREKMERHLSRNNPMDRLIFFCLFLFLWPFLPIVVIMGD